jgi:uncharacterized membrane protein
MVFLKEMTKNRLISLDALRGLILVLMAVDHANYFIARLHPTGEFWGIPLPQYENIFEFLTRLITHPCAPGFFFLMGIGMILFSDSRKSSGWTDPGIRRHFLYRGLILISCQFFLENTAWLMGPVSTLKPPGGGDNVWLHFGVLFSLGAGMIIGALLLRLNASLLFGLGGLIFLISQLIVPGADQAHFLFSPILRVLFIPGRTGFVQVFYAVFPWVGLVLVGMAFGKVISKNRSKISKIALYTGLLLLAAFSVLRLTGGFGNTHPPVDNSFVSLFNVTKYPPSLSFLFLTLGVVLLCLAFLSKWPPVSRRWAGPLTVFGRSSFFFYIVHLYLFGLMGLLFSSTGGTGLGVMYIFWLLGLIILFPLCRLYHNFKSKKPLPSLWRFF